MKTTNKQYRMSFRRLFPVALGLLLLSGCSQGDMDTGTDADDVTATVNLRLAQPAPVGQTRSASETLSNANVLLLNAAGYTIGSTYITASPATGTIKTRAGSGISLCAVGNTTNADYLQGVGSMAVLKKKFVTVTSPSGVSPDVNGVLYGFTDNVTVNADGTTTPDPLTVTLHRLYSVFSFTVTPSADITILGYQVCHVPLSCYVVPQSTSNPGGSFADFDLQQIAAPVKGQAGSTGTIYMFENLQGKVSGSSSEQLRNSTLAPADASYLNIYATNGTWSKVFRIYLGGLATDDYTNFDIPRNYSYTYNVSITTVADDDPRISYTATVKALADADAWNQDGATAGTNGGSNGGAWGDGTGNGTSSSGTTGSSNLADASVWGTGSATGATGTGNTANWTSGTGTGTSNSGTTGSNNSATTDGWGNSGNTGATDGGNASGTWGDGSGNGSSTSTTGLPATGGTVDSSPWGSGTATAAANIGGNGSWTNGSGSGTTTANTTGSSNTTSNGTWTNGTGTAATNGGTVNGGWTTSNGTGTATGSTTGSSNTTSNGTWTNGTGTGATDGGNTTGSWGNSSGSGTTTSTTVNN